MGVIQLVECCIWDADARWFESSHPYKTLWRVGRVVDGTSLENWLTLMGNGGSNPSLSATNQPNKWESFNYVDH